MAAEVFLDSNVILYALSANTAKADRAEYLLRSGGLISVQVLNEVASVARRKIEMPWAEVNEVLALIRAMCSVQPLTLETHEQGVMLAERYDLSVYDAMIVSSALIAECTILYTEDMQDGLRVEGRVLIRNPF